jgi:peptidoglycan hydrolase-like protein with peptidoglycan-binding domain
VGAPWLRRGWGVTVPLFVKRFSDMLLPDGSNIDYNKLDSIPDLDPKQTSSETETFLQGEVAEYEGESNYTVNTNVQNIQNALLALGYQLPNAGADGKFGPETKTALEKFQKDNGLTTSVGKMDRLTTKKLAEKLKGKNLEPNLQNNLNKM